MDVADPHGRSRWYRRFGRAAFFNIKMLIVSLAAAIALAFGGDALLDWKGSSIHDMLHYRQEQRLENTINRVIKDDQRPFGWQVLLSDIVTEPMSRACIEGSGAPGHFWRDGPTRKLMSQSYRPQRRPPFDDYHDTILAVAFADGRVLGFLVPFRRYRMDFGTSDRFACAEGGRIAFTLLGPGAVRIRGY